MEREINEIKLESLMVRSMFPVSSILFMDITLAHGEHGRLYLKVLFQADKVKEIEHTVYYKEQIQVFYYGHDGTQIIFQGRVQKLVVHKKGAVTEGEIYAAAYTWDMDKILIKRSFQSMELSYGTVVEEIAKPYNAGFLVDSQVDLETNLQNPLIQYEETDWAFLKRLASHLRTTVYSEMTTGKPNFIIGLQQGRERAIGNAHIQNFTMDHQFRRSLMLVHKDHWHIGDHIQYEQYPYMLIEKRVIFEKGELAFYDRFAEKSIFFLEKKYNRGLHGLRLEGTVAKTEQESVYVQLDIDEAERTTHPWAWKPEINSHWYMMPEIGEKATICFPTLDESDGFAANTFHRKDIFSNTQNRELHTIHYKKLELYPDQISASSNQHALSLLLSDAGGLRVKSNENILIQAQNTVILKANSITCSSPSRITLQNSRANIDMCGGFNFYAPNGVKSAGNGLDNAAEIKKHRNFIEERPKEVDHWQLSQAAVGAMPKYVDLQTLDEKAILDIVACGAVAKVTKGSSALALKNSLDGKKMSEASFPNAYRAMGNYTVKGGYPLPNGGVK